MSSPWGGGPGSLGTIDWLENYQGIAELLSANAGITASETYFSANSARVSRVWNPRSFRATHAYWFNGTVVAGNVDVGVYDAKGKLIGAAGSTAQSGTSGIQYAPLDLQIPAGEIILAMGASSVTGTYLTPSASIDWFQQNMLDMLGMANVEATVPMPGTLTMVTIGATTELSPIFGVVKRWI